MEFSMNEKSRKERRSSFWRYLPGLSRKVKEKQVPAEPDVTLISANKFYNSFRLFTHKKAKQVSESKHSTLEESNSAENVHKDAGILFLTSDNQLRWRKSEETLIEKHVQFAPTPLNKYHTYADIPKLGKENVCPSNHSTSSILKPLPSGSESFTRRFSGSNINACSNNSNKCRKSLSTDFKIMSLPRTSTKSTLTKQNDVTFPCFDISAINDEEIVNKSGKFQEGLKIVDCRENSLMNNVASTNISYQFEDHIGIPFVPKLKPKLNVTDHRKPLRSLGESQPKEFIKTSEIKELYGFNYPAMHEIESSNPAISNNSQSTYRRRNGANEAVCHKHSVLRHSIVCGEKLNGLSKDNDSAHRASLPSINAVEKASCHMRHEQQQFICQAVKPSVFQRTRSLRINMGDKHQELKKNERINNRGEGFHFSHDHICQDHFQPAFGNNYRSKSFRKTKLEKYEGKSYRPITSSPNHHRSNPVLKQRDYDGMSTVADDERSFNCSCLNCGNETPFFPPKIPLPKRESFRGKLFFPERTLPTILSPRLMKNKDGIRNRSNQTWYDCNDTMCQSPVSTELKNENIEKTDEPIYTNENVLITEDYEIQMRSNSDNSDVTLSNLPFKTEQKDSDDLEKQDIILQNDVMAEPVVENHEETTADSVSLNESCVLALQETLKKILINKSKSTFTVSRLSGGNSQDAQDTFIIQIQSKGDVTAPSLHIIAAENSTDTTKTEGKNSNGSSLCRSQSLPGLNVKNVDEEDMKLSPCKEIEIRGKSLACTAAEESITKSTHSIDVWDKTPSIASNSGYSTVSSTLSVHQISDSSVVANEDEVLEAVIRQGMRLPPIKSAKKPSLNVSSPRKNKFKAKDVLSGKAQLKLNVYHNFGMVTVHVMKAVKLSSVRTVTLNPYVKVMLHPDESRRAHWRTNVVHGESNPTFNQKFSFEIVPEDSTRRLIFSVWHRDKEKKRSEFLGCMSFGLHHVMETDKHLSGWYRLLKEVVGTKKHFAAGHRSTLSKILAN